MPRKLWPHLILWACMLAYLFFANDLYVNFFLRDWKPAGENILLPPKTDQVGMSIDEFNATTYNGQEIYLLLGWAFPMTDPERTVSGYDRRLILVSDKRNYTFNIEIRKRPDVQEYFQNQGVKVENPGFAVWLPKEVIEPGEYLLGMVFREKSSGMEVYSTTKKYLIRTHNQFYLSDFSLEMQKLGKPLSVNFKLPAASSDGKMYLDQFELKELNRRKAYLLVGWAFSLRESEKSQDVLERQLVLASENGNYIFQIETRPRPDVEKAFPDVASDLTNAGFSAWIMDGAIKPGRYTLGMIFRHPQDGYTQYVATNKVVTYVNGTMEIK